MPDECDFVVVDDDTRLGVTWRLYLEPATSVGPSYPEVVYDQIIKFSPVR